MVKRNTNFKISAHGRLPTKIVIFDCITKAAYTNYVLGLCNESMPEALHIDLSTKQKSPGAVLSYIHV
jgi:hypothetical protein